MRVPFGIRKALGLGTGLVRSWTQWLGLLRKESDGLMGDGVGGGVGEDGDGGVRRVMLGLSDGHAAETANRNAAWRCSGPLSAAVEVACTRQETTAGEWLWEASSLVRLSRLASTGSLSLALLWRTTMLQHDGRMVVSRAPKAIYACR